MVLGGRDKMVRAIDLATGKPRWSFATRARVESSPAIAGDRVVVGSSDGKLYVLDLATGQEGLGVRSRRRLHRVARDRRRPHRHRRRGRAGSTRSGKTQPHAATESFNMKDEEHEGLRGRSSPKSLHVLHPSC